MRALLIMGPTASGKSALALALAERIGGEIVNADSMQVYRDFRVLTARPTAEEEDQAPHHLYGHVDAAEPYSTGRWLSDALAAIAAIRARGAAPILVGGTGLYFKALTQGLADIPAPDPEVRAALRARAETEGAPALHAELTARDAQTAARLEPNDAPRILRALEVLETTGESISTLQANTKPALPREEWAGLALTPERASLYQAIDARFEKMLEEGALEEVRAFAARGLDPALPAMKAHGAPALMAHVRGELTLGEAAKIGQRDTRRYAKRQFTWIAGQMLDWPRIAAPDVNERVAAALALLS
ncbi:MAG TPA: tRNA (adenosine(37)-N6)-dimethylallyltransferase MiaA [Vitreimonas sp.]|uniref:tRNA (adenosine(37)-N6)-dimethylallyltransferase MiaA n=1 Tax=Vitreimonas sp. TaxID=3069702 RepID=UPI002D319916|nr:tRNA (adenosine(37)-N6)-dimethylallyltransferase MiaA [Vitreimonas sp.]HYD89355.1 tRNA (adenosine(37)-N6)-dimethylallyltransferase MiaA [Vitreimonas sp.]